MARKLNCVDKYNISWDAFALFFCPPSSLLPELIVRCPTKRKEECVCNDFACLLWTFTMMRIKFAGKCLRSRSKHFVSFRGCSGNVVRLLRLSHVSRFASFPLEQHKHTWTGRGRGRRRRRGKGTGTGTTTYNVGSSK